LLKRVFGFKFMVLIYVKYKFPLLYTMNWDQKIMLADNKIQKIFKYKKTKDGCKLKNRFQKHAKSQCEFTF